MEQEVVSSVSPQGRKLTPGKYGRGRPPGSASYRTRQLAMELANDGGLQPLEVHYANFRFRMSEALTLERELKSLIDQARAGKARLSAAELRQVINLYNKATEMRELADRSAERAAPYVHAKLTSVSIENADGRPFVIQITQGCENL